MQKVQFLIVLLLLAAVPGLAAESAKGPDWSAWQFLMGDWVSEGPPEQGTGGFTLAPDLDGQVLVRHSHADYPPSDTHHTNHHRDLMIVSPRGADYYDNEGHEIHYSVTSGPSSIVLLSEAAPTTPQFRFTYTRQSDDRIGIRFEIAPPGKPFSTYIESTARRVR